MNAKVFKCQDCGKPCPPHNSSYCDRCVREAELRAIHDEGLEMEDVEELGNRAESTSDDFWDPNY